MRNYQQPRHGCETAAGDQPALVAIGVPVRFLLLAHTLSWVRDTEPRSSPLSGDLTEIMRGSTHQGQELRLVQAQVRFSKFPAFAALCRANRFIESVNRKLELQTHQER